jgi:hypothetical protein
MDMMASFKAVLIYFGKREAEAETDQEKFEEVLACSQISNNAPNNAPRVQGSGIRV